ncbi:MAG: LysR family transcriptional regulator [Alphaproteobacteria bacterium]|nr:LysR family transcriptional regulator [Alphaproteobacteria bacterium]
MEFELEIDPRFRNFDWEKAKNFYYVAKLGSFVNAGRFLNLSQSSLSRQVIYLEQHLGCPLFSRHSGGVKLTRKGEELFTIVEATFIGFKGFTRNTHANISNGKKRKIRIATTHADAAYILNDLILDYNEQHPEIVFEIIENDQLIDIFINDVDIAIRPHDPAAQGMQQEPLFALEKKLYASHGYLAKYGEPQTLKDLENHHIIAFGHPEVHPYADVNWILRLGMPEGKLHEPVFTSNSIECLIGAANKGRGIIASYEKMSILKNASLKNILPNTTYKEKTGYFIYPDYLKNDEDIINIKTYLQQKLFHTTN